MSRYPLFDRTEIALAELPMRGHELVADDCKEPAAPSKPYAHPEFGEFAERIVAARRHGKSVVLMMGGHAIKLGLSRYLIDLIERGLVTHLATNGAGIIHDYELAAGGGTSENVAKWIARGQFGLWRETSRLNDLIFDAANRGEGLGEAVGRTIEENSLPFRHLSIAAAGWRCGVPITSHVGIGSDIIHTHANCDGAALGAASYTDFLIFAESVARLEGGVFLNVGSAVTGPEVYLKALSMARNVAAQRGRTHGRLHDRRVRPGRAARQFSPRSAGKKPSAVLLPSLENHPGAHGGRRRAQLLFRRRLEPDHPHSVERASVTRRCRSLAGSLKEKT